MSFSLLSTKLHIPRARANGVSRPRLTEKLLTVVERPGSFVLLSGPAGFGKTTLLSEFVTKLQHPVAWVSIDEGDNDPIRFWTYLITACQTIQRGIGESGLALLQTPQPLPDETIPTILINDVVKLKNNLVLVLDDYHLIQNQSIHAALGFLLDHIPDKLHLVLSTRIDPPWPLARFRARDQLIEIRAVDLRFTTEETASFLNQVMELNLSAENVSALEARTEGWIASLQLAAISMKDRNDITGFIKAFTGSHTYVAEYLIEEVLGHQSEEVKTFLLQTSILGRLNASLCESVSGRPDSQTMLKNLYQANLFVLPLDDEGQWFRYHHLFADLLNARLRQSLAADDIAVLHQRAADWYEHNGFAIEAVNHAFAAKDFDNAARLVEQNAALVMTRGELTTLLQWVAALPGDVSLRHPQIIISKAWALTLAGAEAQVEALLQQIEVQIKINDETPLAHEVQGNAAAIRGYFAMLAGDFARALELTKRAEALLPESSMQARSILPYTLGSAYRGQGQYEKAAEAFEHVAQMGEMSHNLIVWATGVTEVVNICRVQGRLRNANEIGRQALQKIIDQGAYPFGSLAKLEVALSEVLREQNELDEANLRVTSVIARMQAWDMPTDRIFAYLALIHIQEAQGDFIGAFQTLRIAKNLKAANPVLIPLAHAVDFCEIRLYLATGNISTADHLINDLRPGVNRLVSLHEQELIMLARVRLAQGRPDEAVNILDPLVSDERTVERLSIWLEIIALQACALDIQGSREAAVNILVKALTLAEQEGFVRVFVDEGEVMRSLLVAARKLVGDLASIPLKVYISKLIEAFPTSLAHNVVALSPDEKESLVEPLTARELEVLLLVAAGDSNRTIAKKLVITVSAVKKHTGNLFGKLNVNSRTQAVARARELGLFSSDG